MMVHVLLGMVSVGMNRAVSARQWLGCWARERLRTEIALAHSAAFHSNAWLKISNRNERLTVGADSNATQCHWQDSSWLTVAKVFPRVGARIFERSFRKFSIEPSANDAQPGNLPISSVSVIIPMFGLDRLALTGQVIESFQKQTSEAIEILIVGLQSELSRLGQAPSNVRKVCLDEKYLGGYFNKSAALNTGAREARGEILVFHDGDILVPKNYISSIRERLSQVWEFVQPIRFLFCLSERDTRSLIESGGEIKPRKVSDIMQNFPGGSVGIRKDAFTRIGGFDEEFVGWGGEDLEFLDRAQTLKCFKGNFAPAIHLWHPPARKKVSGDRNQAILDCKQRLSVEERIRRLVGNRA